MAGEDYPLDALGSIASSVKRIADSFKAADERVRTQGRQAPVAAPDAQTAFLSGQWKRRDGNIFGSFERQGGFDGAQTKAKK